MEFADNPENKESSGNKRNYQTENLNEYEFNEGENFHTYHCTKSSVAKQNQKFPFHFLSAPPPHPPPGKEEKEGKFWVFAPATEGRGRGAPIRFTTQSERTIQIQAPTRAERATSFVLEIGSNLVQ